MVVAEQKVRVAIFHLPHVAELVVPEVETELLPETQEVAFLNANAPVQIVVSPLAAGKAQSRGNGERPVVAGLDGGDILAVFVRNLDVCVGKVFLGAQETFGFLYLEVGHHVAFAKKEQLADRRFAGLDMNPV